MLTVRLVGALLLFLGILYMARASILRGKLSDPKVNQEDTGRTLEPRHRGFGFLSLKNIWPGLLLIAAGGMMLLLPLLIGAPPHP